MAFQEIAPFLRTNNNPAGAHEAATAEQRATGATTLSHPHVLQTTRPRNNFPLPRELRDQIYGHLLDAKHIRFERARAGGRGYKYHAQILGVNRQVHDEVEEYLYKHSCFVVVCHRLAYGSHDLLPPWIPLVAELGQKPMKYRSLEVTFLPHYDHSEPARRVNAWLLLAKNFDMYFSALTRYVNRNMACGLPKILMLVLNQDGSLVDGSGHLDGPLFGPHYLGLEFGSHRYHKATAEFQSPIISCFRSISCSGLRVEVCGFAVNTPELKGLRTSSRQSLVCASALAWRMFRDLDNLKMIADTLTKAGEVSLAIFTLSQTVAAIYDHVHPRTQHLAPDAKSFFYSS